MTTRLVRTAVAAAVASCIAIAGLAARQDAAAGRATVGGEEAAFAPSLGMWDAAAHRASIVFLTTALPRDAEMRARRAGAWPADVRGPAVLVDIDYAPSSQFGMPSEITACRVQFRGFRTPLELKGGLKECHLLSAGGPLRPGGAIAGLLEGKGPNYSFRLPLSVTFVEVPVATDDRTAVARPTAPARPAAPERPARFEHRVVVSTTSLDREQDVEGSLERNVNALAAVGYELTAFVGGDAGVLDQLLKRRPFVAGLVDHAGLTFAVMARPVDRPVAAREYRLLHTRTGFGVDRIVAPLGAAGFRMSVGAFDGDVTHLAFERTGKAPEVEFRVFRNKGRSAWMDLVLADADAMRRITRVFPIALDAAVIELGAPQPSPGDLKWLSRGYAGFEALEAPLKDLAGGGYRVELVRARRNELDVLVVRPAGATSSAARYDLDDGPWGGPCSRGRLAGAAVQPDGDVACVADLAAEATNRGLDLTVRELASAGGQILFRGPDCDIRARLLSTRPAAPRIAFAVQMEREIDRAIAPGHRVVRAFAARDSNGQMRIVGMTSDERADPPTGPAVSADPGPPLVPELDTPGDDLRRQREARLNAALARTRSTGISLWMELAGARSARLLGCVTSSLDRDQAASAARGLLVKEGLADYVLDNRVIVDR